MQIEILGLDDALSGQVAQVIARALADSGISAVVKLSSDFKRMIELHAFVPPAVMVNGRLKSVGRIPAVEEVRDWLETAR